MQPPAPAPESAPAPVPLRRNPGFRLLWIGQVLSDTGTSAALIAYPLLILALTHSAVIAGVVGTVRLVVELLLGLPGGALADRFDRRLTLIACDSVRAVVLALLAVLVLAHLVSWPIVLVVAAIDGAGAVLFDPAVSAAMPVVVADEQLETAWPPRRDEATPPAWRAPPSAVRCSRSAAPFRSSATPFPTQSLPEQ